MTVDTASLAGADIRAVDAAIAAAEAVLNQRFGSPVTLMEPDLLGGSGPATVVRARVATSSFALPRTLVIKHYPRQASATEVNPFAQEAVSYQLFTALASEERMCPELLAHHGEHQVLVIEDLGDAPTLHDKLYGKDAKAAEHALLSWARSLGRLHATTASREADFNALFRRLSGFPLVLNDGLTAVRTELPDALRQTFDVDTPEPVRRRVDQAIEHTTSRSYRAFSPVELSPDNNLVTGKGVRFLDFEYGRVRNAFIDAAHLRVPFVSGADALALPPGMSEAMVAAWRAEVISIWPAIADDALLSQYLLEGQILQVWSVTPKALADLTPSTAIALNTWWTDLAKDADQIGWQDIAAHARSVTQALSPHSANKTLPVYPAFR